MCRSNNEETTYKLNSVPINLALNLNNNDQIESVDTSDLHINDHLAIDQYLDTLTNTDRNSMNSNSTDNNTNTIFGYQMPVDIFSAFVASSVAAGGLVGYLKAGSKPSLIAGLAFGSLLGVGTYFTSVDPNHANSYYLSLGTSTALGSIMGARFFRSGKFMPAGLISALSLSLAIKSAYHVFTKEHK